MLLTETHHDAAQACRALLEDARARTLALIAPLSEADLRAQHDPLMSPIIWDLGHIASFEELWLTRNLDGAIQFVEMPGLYNPFEHPRATRAALPLPTIAGTLALLADVRARALDHLARAELDDANPLLRDGYVYRMVAQHEYQHNETILQTLQLKRGDPYRAPRGWEPPPPAAAPATPGAMVRFAGGPVDIGTDDRAAAYDNERPRHTATLAPFAIDVAPVTNGEYAAFIADGGYRRDDLWTDAGLAWRRESNATAPKYWTRDGDAWTARTMDRAAPLPTDHPVCHVCYHEAEAYARWAGKRLPTELEWETAASYDPANGAKRDYPWGDELPDHTRANVDQLAFGTSPVGAYAGHHSPLGCVDMIGNVWEWTSSDFGPWPGFTAFPYAEYSEAFFGSDYKVLRGGSWATRPGAIRNTFRNWDYPIRRQIFSGFRCARDG
ncbi:MAG TPA: ergothioneine biosynthesis protein EgtB [Gemmatimonadaceae bacterium]|nr:ergothioneine biosynthesis protein EgtB [Gemmatimonadaceae bacterium]